MPPIRVILFDAGNTLLHVNLEEYRRILARHGIDCSLEQLSQAELRVRYRMDTPEIVSQTNDQSRWNQYHGGILDEIGAPRIILEELHQYHIRKNLWDIVDPETPGLIERLRRHYRLGVVSNSNGTVTDLLKRMGLSPLFEVIIDSAIEGVEKPDPRIFQIALDRMKVQAEESLYIGDIYNVDITGARRAGLRAVLLDPGAIHTDKNVPRICSLSELESLLPLL